MSFIPFYRELVEVLIGLENLKRSLSHIMRGIRIVERLSAEYIVEVRSAMSKKEISRLRREYLGRVSSVIKRLGNDFKLLSEANRKLSRIPDIDPEKPTIIVAAVPNVGKSTLVRKVSSAKPEIAPYPFTTRNLILGHIKIDEVNIIQIMDTPGLLDRPLSERNPIELQAVTALKYLADVIIFLIDPTYHSGYPLDYQLRVLQEIKANFKEIPIVIAINKIDIAKHDEIRIAKEQLLKVFERINLYEISAAKGVNLDKLIKDAIKIALNRKASGGLIHQT